MIGRLRTAAALTAAWAGLGRRAVGALTSSGVSIPANPLTYVRLSRDLLAFGFSPNIGYAAAADRHPDARAIIDDHGVRLTFSQAETATRAAAQWLAERGIGPRGSVAVLGRNSAGFAVAIAAVGRTGADLVYLNTGFTPEQIESLLGRHRVALALVDPQLRERIPAGVATAPLPQLRVWSAAAARLGPMTAAGKHIILTSGTTGRPKGADRSSAPLQAVVSLLAALPYRERGTTVLAAPLFHSWGWMNHRLVSLLDACEVMVARPTADAVLDAAFAHGADLIVTTPVVLRRMADAGPGPRDLSKLQGVLVSGAAVPADVVRRFTDSFGPLLHTLYGSTEAGYATVAGPGELREHPTTAGRPLPGVSVEVRDELGRRCADGVEGRIWVGSGAVFSGYIDGGDAVRSNGMIDTGDLGRIDGDGLLHIHGRSDDVIISGGENVHPAEIEEALRDLPEVADIAAVGGSDPVLGEHVVIHVVPAAGVGRDEVRSALTARAESGLAPYQRPARIEMHDELPHSDTGKVLRRLLR